MGLRSFGDGVEILTILDEFSSSATKSRIIANPSRNAKPSSAYVSASSMLPVFRDWISMGDAT